jgi:acetyl-CoA C-acetyltransferase
MSLDPKTPVVVGVGAVTQHVEDPREGAEALVLMARALERAAEDAGSESILTEIDTIWTPRGFWTYSDPGGWLAERFGASNARTVIAEIGILQTSVLGRAAQALANGRSEVAVIVGGESRDRDSRLAKQGLETPSPIRAEGEPGEVLRPAAEIMGRVEIELGLITPATQYAMIDNALRAHEGRSLEAHREELGRLWGDFNRVAQQNPRAWSRTPIAPDAIVTPGEGNRLIAFPYTKSLVSQWNVNQAGGLILCTLEKAQRLGLDPKRYVYPLAVVDSEHMVTLSERRDLHRSPGFALAGKAALAHVDRSIDAVEHLELYSCFPAAVRVQQRELRVDPNRRVTLTGGMSFAGGPLNNFVIQSQVEMIEALRNDSGSMGLVTAVSGLMTKQGVSLFGAEPERPFLFDTVTDAARAEQAVVDVDLEATGHARVATYTVISGRDGALSVVLVLDFDGGRRTLRVVDDLALAQEGMGTELCGREVEVGSGGRMRWI